jgi:preprotein translocase subunit SecG
LATLPNCVNLLQGYGVVYTAREILASFKSKEITMKQFIAIIATVFAVTAFAQAPAPKKEEKKVEAKPAVTAPAPAASTPAKVDAKSATPAPAAKAETTKK